MSKRLATYEASVSIPAERYSQELVDWCFVQCSGATSNDARHVLRKNAENRVNFRLAPLFGGRHTVQVLKADRPVTFRFANKRDAMLFKLTWGGA